MDAQEDANWATKNKQDGLYPVRGKYYLSVPGGFKMGATALWAVESAGPMCHHVRKYEKQRTGHMRQNFRRAVDTEHSR